MERGTSAVDWQTLNRESPGSNPHCCCLVAWAFSFSPQHPSSPSCMNEYLAIGGGGNESE